MYTHDEPNAFSRPRVKMIDVHENGDDAEWKEKKFKTKMNGKMQRKLKWSVKAVATKNILIEMACFVNADWQCVLRI